MTAERATAAANKTVCWFNGLANVDRMRATGMEFAARRLICRRRYLALKLLRLSPVIRVKRRDRGQQCFGVGVSGVSVEVATVEGIGVAVDFVGGVGIASNVAFTCA